ncbi:MAG: hypothetical protein B6D36_09010 [Planctomycetes bacterium UTPLA1]|jgi:hypothetical protein|nr:MAG: hypothetical protein B6D36_09010 [Planctomycetes bacterium UTPLA1]
MAIRSATPQVSEEIKMRFSLVTLIAVSTLALTPLRAVPPVVQIHPIVLEGDVVAGVGNISSGFGASENHSVNNSGEWLVESDTNNPNTAIDGVILRATGFTPGALFLQQGQAMVSPAGATLSSFDSANINNSGNTSYNHFLANTGGTNNDSGVYYNNDLLIQESDIATAAGFGPNTPYIGFFETKINNNNLVAVMASIDDPNVTSSVDRAIVTVNPFSFVQTRILGEGDQTLVAGRSITDFQTGPHDMALNDSGHIMFVADIDGATTDDTITARYNGVGFDILMREGQPSPVGGRNWGTSAPGAIDMNNSGAWAALADLDGSTSDDALIVRNGVDVIAREGMSLASIGGVFNFTSFGSGSINIDDSGNVIWWGDWNDPDTTRDTGIFWNDQLIVQEGVTLIDGFTLSAISGVESNISMSDNGQWVIFEGTLSNGLDGAFMIEIPEPATAVLALLGASMLIRRRRML